MTHPIIDKETFLTDLEACIPGMLFQFILRPDGSMKVPYASKASQNIFGLDPKDIVQDISLLLNLIHPDDLLSWKRSVQESAKKLSPYLWEGRIVMKSGNVKWIKANSSPKKLNTGDIVWHGIINDITESANANIKLAEREQQLRLFVEHSPASLAMFDTEMNYIITSKRWSNDYNLGDQKLEGKSHYDVFPNIPQRWKEIHQRCLAGATEKNDEDPFVRLDGSTDWVKWEIYPWHKGSGEIGGIIMFTEVVTKRKEIENKLRDNQHFINSINNALPIVIYIYNIKENRNLFVNQKLSELIGYSKNELDQMGSKMFDKLLHPDDLKRFNADRNQYQFIKDEDIIVNEYRLKHKKGNYKWFLGREVIFKRDQNGVPSEVLGSTIDITEKKINDKKLQKMIELNRKREQKEQKIRSIALVKGQEDERHRISREIHDGLGQILTATKLTIDNMMGNHKIPKTVEKKLQDTKTMIKATIVEARRLSNDLMPNVLSDLGLISAIKQLVTQTAKVTETKILFTYTIKNRRFENAVEVTLFRIVQESLNNALKYAKAKKITVSLKTSANRIILEITDDGQGFNQGAMSSFANGYKGGKGIYNMRERAHLIDAEFEISSAPNKGCSVLVIVDLKKK